MTHLNFSVHPKHARNLYAEERYYRIELTDGREVLAAAQDVIVADGCLSCVTDGTASLILPAGSWRSVYMCEAMAAYDPWSILYLDKPGGSE